MLTQDEKDLGVALVDIGAGTTDIAVFTHGAIRHTASLGVAGDQVTNDIAFAFRTPTPVRRGDQGQVRLRAGPARARRRKPSK